MGSEETTLSCTAYDYGYYLQRNDGTCKFTGASPEEITRTVCAEKGIPIAALPVTGAALRRKFSAVSLSRILTTVWTLASEQTGAAYLLRYAPEGLVVKERTVSTSSLVLQSGSNLIDAATKEDASRMVNSVAVYDANGNFLYRTGDAAAQKLYGMMESHIFNRQAGDADAAGRAERTLEEGRLQKTVTVNVLGDTRLVTGETVVVREAGTGLTGIFWIDADTHTWKRGNHYTRLTLNCRNVMAAAQEGDAI